MKKFVLASACILALATTGGAFAQTNQPAPGASGQGEVGPSSSGTMKKGTTTGASGMKNQAGDSMGRQPGSSGGTNTNNTGSQAGGGAGGGSGGK